MKVENGTPFSFDRPRVEKPSKLAIPEKKSDTRDIGSSENRFLRMQIKLLVKAIKLRQDEYGDHHEGNKPARLKQVFPVPFNYQLSKNCTANRNKRKHAFAHDRECCKD